MLICAPLIAAPLSSVTTTRTDDVVLCANAVPVVSNNATIVVVRMERNEREKRDSFIIAPANMLVLVLVFLVYANQYSRDRVERHLIGAHIRVLLRSLDPVN